MKKISIIIPVYNVENYIEKCLNSIINQTYKEIEVILINDGSTDDSGLICDKYVSLDKRIIVLHQKNSGVSNARNNGLQKVTGDYIMFVDPDDWLELNACEVLLNEIEKTQSDIVIYNYYREYYNNTKKNIDYVEKIKTQEDIYKLQATLLAPSMNLFNSTVKEIGFTWNKIIKKEIISKYNIEFPLKGKKAICEDVLFYYSLFEKTTNIKFFNKHLYHYRILSNSATRRYNEQILEVNKETYDIINSKKQEHNNDKFYTQSFYVRMINNLCLTLNVYLLNEKNKLSLLEKRKQLKKIIKEKEYNDAIKKVKIKYLTQKLKIYTILMKYNLVSLIMIANFMEKKIKK